MTGQRPRLTSAERDAITTLAEQGFGAKKISMVVGRHESAVQWFLYSQGLRAPAYGNARAHVRRNGRPGKPFTREEDQVLIGLREAGQSIGEIAKHVTARFAHPRSPDTVRNRLVMLASREEALAS